MLELYYNFFDKYCDITKFEELEMDTDSLYLALSEHDLCDCIRPTMKKEYNSLRSGDCTDEFSANSTTNFFPRTCCAKHKEHDRGEPGLFKEEIGCTEMVCLCSKTYCCYDSQSKKFKPNPYFYTWQYHLVYTNTLPITYLNTLPSADTRTEPDYTLS